MTRDTLRKLHSFTGLFPLGAYLLFHAYEHLPVRLGRDAELARLLRTSSWPLEVAAILLPLLGHAGLGLYLAWWAPGPGGEARHYASPAFRRLQLASGLVTLAFLGLHVSGVWLPRALDGDRPGAAYAAQLDQVASLPLAAVYVLGVTAVCLHFGQGLAVLCERHGFLQLTPRGSRLLGAGLGVALWLTFIDELAAYATGAALL